MTTIRVLVSRVLDLLLWRRREERLAEEIQAHLDMLSDEYAAGGLPPEDARAAARRAFGGVEQVKEVHRAQRGLPALDALTQDARFALRLLARDRWFTITALLVLGLGIGVNTMLFTIVNAHALRGLPIHRVDRFVFLSMLDGRGAERGVSYPDFESLRSTLQRVDGLAAFTNAPVNVADDETAPERLDAAFVSADAFPLIGVQPILGRGFDAADDRTGAPAVALLGTGVWHARYGGDGTILGRTILIDDAPATVIGIVPERSGFPSTAQVWLPLLRAPGLAVQRRDARILSVLGRLREGGSVADARTEIDAVSDRLSRAHPDTNAGTRIRVVPINDRYLGRLTDPAWLAFISVGVLVVLISCANVANLLLAKSVSRTREIAIRTALGASRARVVRQLLIEGAVLAAAGGVLAIGVAAAGVRVFHSAIPEQVLPYWFDYAFDGRVVGALIAVSAGTVFVFALLPAIHASRTDVNGVLKDGGRSSATRRGVRRWTAAFLVAELALAVVLLAQLSVNLRLAAPPLASDIVLDSRDVLTAALSLPPARYATVEQRASFYAQLTERLRTRPGVAAASIATHLPLSGAVEQRLAIDGPPGRAAADLPAVWTLGVTPGYFDALKLAIVRGRAFIDADGAPGFDTAIVNERLAQMFFPDTDPVGQRISVHSTGAGQTASTLTIVGVAPSIRQRLRATPDPVIYLPLRSAPGPAATLIVRAAAQPESLAALLREEVRSLDAGLPLYRLRPMSQVLRDAQWNGRLSNALFNVLTLIAAALATVGLYAVTAHAVSQRTQEIGVRMALGARPREVAGLIVRQALKRTAAGFLAGIGCTLAWDGLFSTGRAGVAATDPQSLLIVGALLALLMLIACAAPALRATRLDPVAAIRAE